MDWVSTLHDENLLAVLDVALDMEKELQFDEEVRVPLIPRLVRFRQLLPADSIGLRDRYLDLRWKAANLLQKHGAILGIETTDEAHRWDTQLIARTDPVVFPAVVAALNAEHERRMGIAKAEAPPLAVDPLAMVLKLLHRFHAVAVELRRRRAGSEPLVMEDEYDVQYLLHALLRIEFEDIRDEVWTPSYAGRQSRVDFLLPREKIVVEVKMARAGHAEKQIGDELIIDIDRYSKMPECDALVCLVYDPGEVIKNPEGFRADLTRKRDGLTVEVVIIPAAAHGPIAPR